MTTPTPEDLRAQARRRLLIEVTGLLLLIVGVAAVAVAAFATDWRLGAVTVGSTVGALGFFMSTGKV